MLALLFDEAVEIGQVILAMQFHASLAESDAGYAERPERLGRDDEIGSGFLGREQVPVNVRLGLPLALRLRLGEMWRFLFELGHVLALTD